MMKKQKRSRNRDRARVKAARLEERIANQRKDLQEKLALQIVKQYQVIGIEDLDLKGIAKFLRNAKNINGAGRNGFVSRLGRKASRFSTPLSSKLTDGLLLQRLAPDAAM